MSTLDWFDPLLRHLSQMIHPMTRDESSNPGSKFKRERRFFSFPLRSLLVRHEIIFRLSSLTTNLVSGTVLRSFSLHTMGKILIECENVVFGEEFARLSLYIFFFSFPLALWCLSTAKCLIFFP